MTGPPDLWIAVLIVAGAVLALARLELWRRADPAAAAGPSWRFPALIGLNVLTAGLLYLTLAPPSVGLGSGQLVVRTAGAAAGPVRQTGDRVFALPEAPDGPGERIPDLATALRRHPEARAVHVLGAGLVARDRAAVDREIVFSPPALPSGFVRLSLPDPVVVGARFAVGGTIGASTGHVELADPSGRIMDSAPVRPETDFVLLGTSRAPGLALLELRLKDAQDRLIERIDIPVEARETTPPRVVVMAGAPGPDVRFLRRWAEDAGIDLSLQLSLGAGVDLTARPTPLIAQTLRQTDLLVIDERRWEALNGGERAAVRTATAAGMGLLLRPTGPLSQATRSEWAALGASLSGGDSLRPLVLSGAPSGTTAGASSEQDTDPIPDLTRREFATDPDAAVLVRDADGNALATWRPFGNGRVGVWVVADSYALILTGRSDVYGTLWSRMFSTLARAEGERPPRLSALARAGERARLCGVQDGDTVIGPDARTVRLILDPRSGPPACAGFWPTRAGWHAISGDTGDRGAVYVHPAGVTPSLVVAERRQATMGLRDRSAQTGVVPPVQRSGSPWPWFAGLLISLAGLWWLERQRPPPKFEDL